MSILAAHLHAAFHEPNSTVYRYVQGLIAALIFLSILLLVLEVVLSEASPARAIVPRIDQLLLTILARKSFCASARFGRHRSRYFGVLVLAGSASTCWLASGICCGHSCSSTYWPCWHCFRSCAACARCAC